MAFDAASAQRLNRVFFCTCVMSILFDLNTKQFVAKPIYLVYSLIGLVAQTLYTLLVGVTGQLQSKWYTTATTFVDVMAIFCRDSIYFFGYPVFIVMLHSSRWQQKDFLNKAIALYRQMNGSFGSEPLLLQQHLTGTWVKCVAWIAYYYLFFVPYAMYLYDTSIKMENIIYFCCYIVSVTGIGQALSYIELCIDICFRQTDRLNRVVVNSLLKVHFFPHSLVEVITAMDMIRKIEELRQLFGASFAKPLYCICQMVMINSVFILYLTLQRIATSDFKMQTIDVLIYYLPVVVRIFRLIGRMQEFGTKVRMYYIFGRTLNN